MGLIVSTRSAAAASWAMATSLRTSWVDRLDAPCDGQ